jgi:hypothetical protein
VRTLLRRLARTVVASAIVVGCSDSTGPKSTFTAQQKSALITALDNSDAFGNLGSAASVGVLAIEFLNSTGKLESGAAVIAASAAQHAIEASVRGIRATGYEGAVGVQLIMTNTSGAQPQSFTYTSVVGWSGLNVAAQTVDEVVVAGALTGTATPVANGSSTSMGGSGSTYAFAVYGNRASASSYEASSGAFTLGSTSFGGGGTDCSASAQGFSVSCAYTIGTMAGNFAFDADLSSGNGAATYSQAAVHYANLPALRMVVSGAF